VIIAIASGKGGTGKTTLSVNLALAAQTPIQLLDCDVEAPNAHLFLNPSGIESTVVHVPIPVVDESACDGCGECGRMCEYHAIVSFGSVPLVFPEMCHGCGGCMRVCPRHAISEKGHRIGEVHISTVGHITLIEGKIDVGIAMAPPLIRAVKSRLSASVPVLLDAPPGTSCPVIASIRDADFVILVTEPTAFGLHDLSLAVDMTRALNRPFAVVVNRMGIGDDRVHQFCREEGIRILAEIPDDRRIAEAYSEGRTIVDAIPAYRGLFHSILNQIGILSHSH